MNDSNETFAYREALKSGTELLTALCDGSLSPEDFISKYGNFFYEYAFHGDEATDAQSSVIKENVALCALHEEVQRLVYLLYTSDKPVPEYEAAGRQLPATAAKEIVRVAKAADVESLLERLKSRVE